MHEAHSRPEMSTRRNSEFDPDESGWELSSAKPFKVVVLGKSGVGKTTIASRVCHGKVPSRPFATVGVDFETKYYTIDDSLVKLYIWDTAGQERFKNSLAAHYFRDVSAVVFVYDVTNVQSFTDLYDWIELCDKRIDLQSTPCIVIGNKCDVGNVKVPSQIAKVFSEKQKMPLYEVSALDPKSYDQLNSIFFNLAVRLTRTSYDWPPASRLCQKESTFSLRQLLERGQEDCC